MNADQPPIQRLGQYEILEELGRGGFAVVYRAHDIVLKRDVALKILHPALMADPAFVARFENDARAAAQLEHPHIVTIYELGQREGRLYIAMQLLSGGSLADRIAGDGPLPFADAVHVVGEVAEALDYAHRQGFVHRDVKPTNILFNARGEAVLTDLGLVKAAESSLIARSSSGGIVGTPAYIAPEVWEGQEAGPAADVYALGCVLYEMLTGQPLFQGGTPPAVMMAHFQPHRYPEAWPEGVPAEIDGLLERALARDPAERYASAGAFAADLQALAARAADPLAEPYRALQAALAAEDWPQALRLGQQIAAQDPDYRDAGALAQRAAEAQARAERAQWAAQWRQQALDAEAAGKMDAARAAAQRWLEMAPGDGEAQALLQRVTTGRIPEPLPRATSEPRAPVNRRLPVWVMAVGALALLLLVIVLAVVLGGGKKGAPDVVVKTPMAGVTPTQGPIVHTVQLGETISGVALAYGVSEVDIIDANDLQNPNFLQVGSELIIPIGSLPQITPTWTPPAEENQAEITEIIAPGDADREAVVITNKGKQRIDMKGWILNDAEGNAYTFLNFVLWPGGNLMVNTRMGQDGSPAVNQLYWGKVNSIWTIGELATLKDTTGKVICTFGGK